jgi:signal transduction histidine kinase
MKILILSILLLLSFTKAICQNKSIDSLNQELAVAKDDTTKVTLIAAVVVFSVFTFFLFRSNRYKQKAYTLLQQQKHDIETQNVKAQIEAALERVRAQAIAMHDSEDIGNAFGLLCSELDNLGFANHNCGIYIFDESDNAELWTSPSTKESKVARVIGKLNMTVHPMLRGILNAWKEKELFFLYELSGGDRRDYYESLATSTGSAIPLQNKEGVPFSADREFCNAFFFAQGCLLTFTSEAFSDEKKLILEKFASVSGLTYRRYLDLKLAEEQAREAAIEAALERVRVRAMAMHDSKDISKAASAMFNEFDKLGIAKLRCGVAIAEEPRTWELWTVTSTDEGNVIQIIGKMDVSVHPLPEGAFNAWEQDKPFFTYELAGEDVLDYYKAISTASGYTVPPKAINTSKQVASVFFFKGGGVFIYTVEPLSKEIHLVTQRFTEVFAMTYQRHLDLKQFEEQVRKAMRETSLDRVRAEIASMRSTEDLQRITPLMWRELHTLKVPFVRCGVFIVNEVLNKVHFYLSAQDGRTLGVLKLPIDDNELTRKSVEHWRKATIYSTHWNKEQFLNWMQSMIDRGQILNKETYQGETNPPESLDLYFVPFTQGMLYVSNTAPLTGDEIQLVKSLAESFAIAYARYEDFKKLQDAKNRVEVTLSELKSAQTQLIQSEKMASIGELTAGIAHEIQNPLNFVNNFSEVSNDLLNEMITQLENNNKEDAIAIADDVKQNLEKILHHGQRADGIIKGMLQHSRSSSGIKEPTDINKLADEYLRLVYHGLRAKEKSLNVALKTDYDESIGNINIIQQDIGRAILNLITNAFYAVTEKKKAQPPAPSGGGVEYEPTVSVSTEKINGKVEIRVADNGNGIPEKVLDKIFQPFFTTKPAGQGTGLGLSLSYDIAKACGGEIKVETKENEGAEFIIQLPI